MSDTTQGPVIEADLLTPVVSLSVGRPIAELSEWAIEPIHGGAGDTLGVYRVAGEVMKDGTAVPWSVILKVIGRPERGGELVDWNYWRREALFYQSDLVAELPRGLERPHCLGVAARPGDQLWLWLEDIDERIAEWTLDDYGRVAYRVAGFNSPYLCGEPIPDERWLSRGWLRGKIVDAASAVALLPTAVQTRWCGGRYRRTFRTGSCRPGLTASSYLRILRVADQGLSASITNKTAYRDAGRRMLLVLDRLKDLDKASRALAATANVELPPLDPDALIA